MNAQANGAVGILFVNNNTSTPGTWSGVAPSVTIPMIGVSLADGNAVRTAAGSGVVTLNIGLDPAHRAGANDAGLARMFDPNPDQQGSSVSHFDVTAYPNQLMEPSINADLANDISLTYDVFVDIGWFPQVTAVGPEEGELAFSLGPNPSRDGGTVRFGLRAARDVDIAIFDVAGHRAPAGIYLVRLSAGRSERSARFVLMD